MRFILLTVLLLSALAGMAYADTWALPEKRTICSKSGKYCLQVIPKKLTSQLDYFQDKSDGKGNAGADKKVKKNLCRGIYSVRDDNGILRKRWEINLVNEVSPVDVLVSNSGKYVITFDNWHSVGYGDDVVAIYEAATGNLIRKLGLSDFLTESDINELPKSVSSIWWGGTHWIEKEKNQLVLQVTKGKRAFEKDAEFFDVRVQLGTGEILGEKRDRLPTLRFSIQPIGEEPTDTGGPTSTTGNSSIESEKSQRITSVDLLKKAITKEMPNYPPVAIAVRATGKVMVEILIATDGTVECVRAVSGHPFLRASVVAAVKKWTFQSDQRKYSGFVVFEATSALVAPDGTVLKEYR